MIENHVLVDSSVWLDYLRGEPKTIQILNRLIDSQSIVICGQILQELLQGARDTRAFNRLLKEMDLAQYEAEERQDFVRGARIFADLRSRGITIPPSDCLVGAVAIRRRLQLYAHDSHFDHIDELRQFQEADGLKTSK